MRSTSLTKLTATALAAAAIVPAAAMGADVNVESLSLSKATKHSATVNFQTDDALPRRAGGGINGTVSFDGGSFSIATTSHADNRYTSWVKTRRNLKAGMKFKVRIAIDGQAPIVRTLRLK